MSLSRSLTLGLRDQLRAATADGGLAIDPDICEVMLDGRPMPNCGAWFFAVHDGDRTNQSAMADISMCTCMVTISRRIDAPFDRLGSKQIAIVDGLMDQGDMVWTNVFSHQWTSQYYPGETGVMQRANAYLPSPGYKWTEGLFPQQRGSVQPVGADWFMATDEQQHKTKGDYSKKMPYYGLTLQIRFGGAVLMQNNADAGS